MAEIPSICFLTLLICVLGFPGGSEVKASAWNEGDPGSIPELGRFPWRRKWQPTPVLLPGESHGGRNLVGYSPWGRKESDTTERLHFHFHFGYYKIEQTCCKKPETSQIQSKKYKFSIPPKSQFPRD